MEQIWHNIINELTYHPSEPLIFSTGLFLVLFVAFSFVYMLLGRRTTVRLAFVTAFSYYFYYKSSGFYFLLLAFVTASDYLIANQINKCWQRDAADKRSRRLWLALSLVVDLGLLGYFKYTNFIFGSIAQLFHQPFKPWDIFLPVGISFFTFQSLSYTIDVYRGKIKPVQSLLDYAFYVSFFPQLVAGPIVRAADFIPQIRRAPYVSTTMMSRGVYLIIIGLIKKAIISDYISLNFVDRVFNNPALYSGVENLAGVYGYALQIYCDFSGYSDMAIGLALLLGFHFPDNFRSPYLSTSIGDFWHRWHISLSSWIRDYVYISFGGNRKGKVRTYVNLLASMLLCGLWHGASLNFVLWGGIHGVFLCLQRALHFEVLHHDKHYVPKGFRKYAGMFFTFNFVAFMFMIFRHQSFQSLQMMVRQIVCNFHTELFLPMLSSYRYVFMLILLGYIGHAIPPRTCHRVIRLMSKGGMPVYVLLLVLVIYAIIQVKSSSIQPFIYFSF